MFLFKIIIELQYNIKILKFLKIAENIIYIGCLKMYCIYYFSS